MDKLHEIFFACFGCIVRKKVTSTFTHAFYPFLNIILKFTAKSVLFFWRSLSVSKVLLQGFYDPRTGNIHVVLQFFEDFTILHKKETDCPDILLKLYLNYKTS